MSEVRSTTKVSGFDGTGRCLRHNRLWNSQTAAPARLPMPAEIHHQQLAISKMVHNGLPNGARTGIPMNEDDRGALATTVLGFNSIHD